MLKSDIIWPKSRRYKSKTEWEPLGFFSESLCNASSFDLMLGFFSSSAISVLADSFAIFLHNGGRMRLIINDILTEPDKQAILCGQSESLQRVFFNLTDIGQLKETLSRQDKHFFDCLSWLIANNRIEFKIISPIDSYGISHTKCGIFSDGINKVAFDGSCNFSRTALIDNIESITAECDWDGEVSRAKIENIESDFSQTFLGYNDTVKYIDASDIKTHITSNFPVKDLNELLQEEQKLLNEKTDDLEELPAGIKRAILKAQMRIQNTLDEINAKSLKEEKLHNPHFPFQSGPREYQVKAFNAWKENKQRGLFAMGTGTGKTITSLNCLLEIFNKSGYYKALILVPTITLVNQWESECRKFGFTNIVKVCSKFPNWKQEIDSIDFNESVDTTGKKNSYIIISTYASFARDNVYQSLSGFPRKQVLLIADEAHNMGAGQILKRLKSIPYLRRIGLSATPERQFDTAVNNQLMRFFGCEGHQYTFEYTMAEAIENGFLCRYKYYPHVIRLNTAEMEQYLEISRKLAQYYTFNEESFEPKGDPILTALLIKRKSIIHKAANKLPAFKNIVQDRLNVCGSLKYTLVYVPEGNMPDDQADIFDEYDSIPDDKEAIHLIDTYTKTIRDLSPTITVSQFTAASKNRDTLLRDFAEGKLGVLTSMKCLDEGVDVPRSELAIFCASTGNPRQFIQRRGRILRTHKDKHLAEIHDLIVAPEVGESEETYNMERNLLRAELRRVQNFAELSENMDDTIRELEDILNYYAISIFNP
jgi:superfamily II DNA or RNA helicase